MCVERYYTCYMFYSMVMKWFPWSDLFVWYVFLLFYLGILFITIMLSSSTVVRFTMAWIIIVVIGQWLEASLLLMYHLHVCIPFHRINHLAIIHSNTSSYSFNFNRSLKLQIDVLHRNLTSWDATKSQLVSKIYFNLTWLCTITAVYW